MGLKVTRIIKQGVGEPIYTEHVGALLHWDIIGVVMFIVFMIFWPRHATAKGRKLIGCVILTILEILFLMPIGGVQEVGCGL